MANRLALVLLTTFHLTIALSQGSKYIPQVERIITTDDSTIANGVNIGKCIRPQFADDGGGIFLKHHYIMDTTKRILYKAVYDYVGFDQVTFYYNNQKIIKAVVSDSSSKGNPYQCEYYFDNDSLILIREQGIRHPEHPWNSQTVISQAKEYLIDFFNICDMMDKRK
jgi:hypothetical protein